MNKLSHNKRCQIVSALVEGNSIRSTARIVNCSINTVVKLLVDIGSVCAKYQDETLRNLKCRKIQCDEIWSFCYAKQKNVPNDMKNQFGFGDVWTWVAIDSETKLVVSYLVGLRNADWARVFMFDVASRLSNRVQITTDGFRPYLEAVDQAFGVDVDYAMLVKLYGKEIDMEARYSPPKCIGTRKHKMNGKPKRKDISTSHIERQNLTMRMSMRRFTRLTNAFSKKIENLEHAVALHFMYYNFVRIHKTLRCTPAMEASVTDRLWEISDIVRLLERIDRH